MSAPLKKIHRMLVDLMEHLGPGVDLTRTWVEAVKGCLAVYLSEEMALQKKREFFENTGIADSKYVVVG